MIALGLACLLGAYKVFNAASMIQAGPPNPDATYAPSEGAGGTIGLIGTGLGVLGVSLIFAACVPTRIVERVFRASRMTLWENPSSDDPHGPWR